jgi:hypothetical protein
MGIVKYKLIMRPKLQKRSTLKLAGRNETQNSGKK